MRANRGSVIGSDMARQRRLFLVGGAEDSCSQSAESIKDAGVIMNWMRAGATDAVRLHTRPSPLSASAALFRSPKNVVDDVLVLFYADDTSTSG